MDADQKYYDAVGQELKDRQLKPGLWARAVAETKTEGAEARALYIKLRVDQMVEQERMEVERQKQAEVAKAKAARLAVPWEQRPAFLIIIGLLALGAFLWLVLATR